MEAEVLYGTAVVVVVNDGDGDDDDEEEEADANGTGDGERNAEKKEAFAESTYDPGSASGLETGPEGAKPWGGSGRGWGRTSGEGDFCALRRGDDGGGGLAARRKRDDMRR